MVVSQGEKNPSSAIYALNKSLRAIESVRDLLDEHSKKLGNYTTIQKQLDSAEQDLRDAITAYRVRADQESPNIGKDDGRERGGILRRLINKIF